jgi:HEAT repeat protein
MGQDVKGNSADELAALITQLSQGDVVQRASAAIDLAVMGIEPQRVAWALVRALQDPVPMVRASAAEGLGYLRVPQAKVALQRACRDQDPEVREAAEASLQRLGGANEDRRVSDRLPTRIPVKYFTPRSTALRHGTVLNLSRNGLFLGETAGLSPGMEIRLVFQDRRVPPLGCSARVVREADRKETDGGYGCALLPLPDEKARWLDRLLELHAA